MLPSLFWSACEAGSVQGSVCMAKFALIIHRLHWVAFSYSELSPERADYSDFYFIFIIFIVLVIYTLKAFYQILSNA